MFCNVCRKSTNFTADGKCMSCKERKDIEFDKLWYNKTLEDKVDWLYDKVKSQLPRPEGRGL